jgi:hypothetical protein
VPQLVPEILDAWKLLSGIERPLRRAQDNAVRKVLQSTIGKADRTGKGLLSGFGEPPRPSGLKVPKIATFHPVRWIDGKAEHVNLFPGTICPCFEQMQFGLAVECRLDAGNKRCESTDVSSDSVSPKCRWFDRGCSASHEWINN